MANKLTSNTVRPALVYFIAQMLSFPITTVEQFMTVTDQHNSLFTWGRKYILTLSETLLNAGRVEMLHLSLHWLT